MDYKQKFEEAERYVQRLTKELNALQIENARLENEVRELELRYNPNHDPTNGRFTDSTGGGAGAVLYVGKGQKGKGAYVVNSSNFSNSTSKGLPEEFSEQVGKYKITEKKIVSATGKSIQNDGKYEELSEVPKQTASQARKIASQVGIEDPVLTGNMIVPRTVAEKAKAIKEQSEENYRKNLENNVPGLEKVRKAQIDSEIEYEKYKSSIEKGDGKIYSPKTTNEDVAELKKQYPAATAYLKAESYSNASNYHKSVAGQNAVNAIRKGEKSYTKAIEDMEKEWSESALSNIWN